MSEAVVLKSSVKKDALRNFARFAGEHLCQRLSFDKIAGLRPATLLKKILWHRCFPVNFVKFLRTPFFIELLWWLLFNCNTYKFKHFYPRWIGGETEWKVPVLFLWKKYCQRSEDFIDIQNFCFFFMVF